MSILLLTWIAACGTPTEAVVPGLPVEAPTAAEPVTASRIPEGTMEQLQRLVPSVDEAALVVEQRDRALAQIEMATYCAPGVDPATARYSSYNPGMAEVMAGDSCFLPWARSRALQPESSEEGWVDLNLAGITCGESQPLDLERAVRRPDTFYVRLPEGTASATLRARTMRGVPSEGDFLREGWGEWRPVFDGVAPATRVLALPLADVVGDANHWVQLEVALGDGSARTVELLWPVSC